MPEEDGTKSEGKRSLLHKTSARPQLRQCAAVGIQRLAGRRHGSPRR
jgi:hypothetical protein